MKVNIEFEVDEHLIDKSGKLALMLSVFRGLGKWYSKTRWNMDFVPWSSLTLKAERKIA